MQILAIGAIGFILFLAWISKEPKRKKVERYTPKDWIGSIKHTLGRTEEVENN